MFCSTSITTHLLRGLGAALLITLALGWPLDAGPWLRGGALLGAALLMRGCPMCWLMGLVETCQQRLRRQPPGPAGGAG